MDGREEFAAALSEVIADMEASGESRVADVDVKSIQIASRYDEFNYATKGAETQEQIQLRQDPVYENIANQEYQNSNTSVSVTTMKPLSAKNGFQLNSLLANSA